MDKAEAIIKVAEMAEPVKQLDKTIKALKQLNSPLRIAVYGTGTVVTIDGLSEEDMHFIKSGLVSLLDFKRNVQVEKLQDFIKEELK